MLNVIHHLQVKFRIVAAGSVGCSYIMLPVLRDIRK